MDKWDIWISFGIWMGITILIISGTYKLKSDKRGLIAGSAFTLFSVLGTLSIYHYFQDSFQCHAEYCWADKTAAETLVRFVMITWGAFGGTFLAKAIDSIRPSNQ